MGVFPRFESGKDPIRDRIKLVNSDLAKALSAHPEIKFLDIGNDFLQPDGTLPKTIMDDGTHPTEAGYEIWAKALVAAGVRS
jgi:lysophospholipase L1-like esterase